MYRHIYSCHFFNDEIKIIATLTYISKMCNCGVVLNMPNYENYGNLHVTFTSLAVVVSF